MSYSNIPVPSSYSLLLPWLQNSCVKFPVHGPLLGYTAGQILAVQNDCNEAIYLLLTVRTIVEQDAAEMSDYISRKINGPIGALPGTLPTATALLAAPVAVVPAGIVPRMRALVTELKVKSAFVPAMGKSASSRAKPNLTAARVRSRPSRKSLGEMQMLDKLLH